MVQGIPPEDRGPFPPMMDAPAVPLPSDRALARLRRKLETTRAKLEIAQERIAELTQEAIERAKDTASLRLRNDGLETQEVADAQVIRAAQWREKKNLAKLEMIGKIAQSVKDRVAAGVLPPQFDHILDVLDAPEIPESIAKRYA
jgi:hypothetical protein